MLELSERDRAMANGDAGPAAAFAMRLITAVAEMQGARRLVSVTGAHIDGCLYHGQVGLDFASRLVAMGGRVAVPTTLNVTSLDLLHPELYRGDPDAAQAARALMAAYVELGCAPTWTCAPYSLPNPPQLGEHVAWAESNAIVFANSYLGARTNRYGDFIDVCAAITGRAPRTGLHRDEGRRASVVFDIGELAGPLRTSPVLFPLLGALIGDVAGSKVAAVVGMGSAGEDDIKALGAAAASTGSIALVHVVGITPEAPSLEAVRHEDAVEHTVTTAELIAVRDALGPWDAPLDAVSLGTPHASLAELGDLVDLLDGRTVDSAVDCYVNTGRDTYAEARTDGLAAALEQAGVQVVVDTCTYITPIVRQAATVMTDSVKWAFYAPGNIGATPVFGSRRECVESAVAGRVRRDEELWRE